MRLRDPEKGTVIHVGEIQSARYLARGWVDADKPVVVIRDEPAPEPPRRGRPPKK